MDAPIRLLQTLQDTEQKGTVSQTVQNLATDNSVRPIIEDLSNVMINHRKIDAWKKNLCDDYGRLIIPYTFDSTYYRRLSNSSTEFYQLWYGVEGIPDFPLKITYTNSNNSNRKRYHNIGLSRSSVSYVSRDLRNNILNHLANTHRQKGITFQESDAAFENMGGIAFAACGQDDSTGEGCIIPISTTLRQHSFHNKVVPIVGICFPTYGSCTNAEFSRDVNVMKNFIQYRVDDALSKLNSNVIIPYTFDPTYYRVISSDTEFYPLWYGLQGIPKLPLVSLSEDHANVYAYTRMPLANITHVNSDLQHNITHYITEMGKDLSNLLSTHVEFKHDDNEFARRGGIAFAACGNNDNSGKNCIIPFTWELQEYSFINRPVPVVRICFPERGGCYRDQCASNYGSADAFNSALMQYNVAHETTHALGMNHYSDTLGETVKLYHNPSLLYVSIMGKEGNRRTDLGPLDKLLLAGAYGTDVCATFDNKKLCGAVAIDQCTADYHPHTKVAKSPGQHGDTGFISDRLGDQFDAKNGEHSASQHIDQVQTSGATSASGSSWFNWIIPRVLLSTVGTVFSTIKSKLLSTQESPPAVSSSPTYRSSTAKKMNVRTSVPQLDLDSQIMFFSVIIHLLRKFSPFTLPWNKKHVLTSAEETSLYDILNNTQIVMKQIHKLQKTPAIQEVFLADKFAYICRELDSENALSIIAEIDKILRKASEERTVTRSQIESWENRLTKIQTYLRQIEDFNNQYANLTQETEHLAARYPNNYITVKRSYDYINNRLKQAFSSESKTANVPDEKCEQKARQYTSDENLTQNMEYNLRHVVPNLHSTHEGRPLIADAHTDTTSSPVEAKGIALH